jgi:hypothetical protein
MPRGIETIFRGNNRGNFKIGAGCLRWSGVVDLLNLVHLSILARDRCPPVNLTPKSPLHAMERGLDRLLSPPLRRVERGRGVR